MQIRESELCCGKYFSDFLKQFIHISLIFSLFLLDLSMPKGLLWFGVCNVFRGFGDEITIQKSIN